MRIGRISPIAALAMAVAMTQSASQLVEVRRDEDGDPVRFVHTGRRNVAAQWKRETGQVRRKGLN